jgi:glycosyltransferase involved in cell wall biosynthesis
VTVAGPGGAPSGGEPRAGEAAKPEETAGPGEQGAGVVTMRVAYVLGTTVGGTGSHVAMLAGECAARGTEVRVFGPQAAGQRFFPALRAPAACPDGSRNPVTAEGMGGRAAIGSLVPDESPAFVGVDIADRPRPAHDLATVLRLRRLLRAWAPDIVHAHGLRAGAFTALALTALPPAHTRHRPMILKTFQSYLQKSLQDHEKGRQKPDQEEAGGMARRRWERCALVVTMHNAPPAGGANGLVYAILERIVARRADAVTWVSSDLGARVRRAGARDGGRALVPAAEYTPPSAEQIAAVRASLGEHRPVVLAAGRLVAQKGYPVLLAAAAHWQHRDPVPLLVIAGEGPLAGALAEQARNTGIAVRFLGQRTDVPALLGAADVVVVPSFWEGQPLIVQEALRAGRPLVASRVGGIPDVTGEDAALLVPPGDPAALARAVQLVLDDPGLAAKLGAAAADRAGQLPSVGAAVESVTRCYRHLLRSAD